MTVWSVLLIVVAIGPIDYSNEPSAAVLALVGAGISLFILGEQAGAWSFRLGFANQRGLEQRTDRLGLVVGISSCAGIAGIGLIALDRIVLSGVSNSAYAELLRCAPDLIDIVEIKRTPLLYVGYLLFSFGFASVVPFLLKGEQIRGSAAVLAQLSILSPVGYALLYAGRMPMLFVILLMIAAVFVRLAQGRPALPEGHHLPVKIIVAVLVFGIYSSTVWSSRKSFCMQMNGVIRELQQRMQDREARLIKAREQARAQEQEQEREQSSVARREAEPPSTSPQGPASQSTPGRKSADDQKGSAKPLPVQPSAQPDQKAVPDSGISAVDLGKMIVAGGAGSRGESLDDITALLLTMDQAWHTKPSDYVIAAIESGRIAPRTAEAALSTYFYLTHGVRILDWTWHARERLSPHWGVYQIGVLSPILRVFFPQSGGLASLKSELQSAGIFGFFPTVWAAAYIDFGVVGAAIYILIWGFAAGWSAFGARHSNLTTPALLLTFIIASILLSPVQGPLGIANSALVLLSVIVVGFAVDFGSAQQSAADMAITPRAEQAPDAG